MCQYLPTAFREATLAAVPFIHFTISRTENGQAFVPFLIIFISFEKLPSHKLSLKQN